ncbi:hypothetical protein CEXT_412921 [Caerostris extrusa]|uniref:Uncharacterized protein n=1 Tax=Caerostris extrusa TaxID=172846 RepID=A0AAV4N8P0_CAEEX|nr:hypothetical protein CEXT_412921 [Caerostris extrusa]
MRYFLLKCVTHDLQKKKIFLEENQKSIGILKARDIIRESKRCFIVSSVESFIGALHLDKAVHCRPLTLNIKKHPFISLSKTLFHLQKLKFSLRCTFRR